MSKHDKLKDFALYVKSFYGPNQIYGHYFDHTLTDFELGLGIGIYLERLSKDNEMTWGGGDSVDRERVRDILLSLRAL